VHRSNARLYDDAWITRAWPTGCPRPAWLCPLISTETAGSEAAAMVLMPVADGATGCRLGPPSCITATNACTPLLQLRDDPLIAVASSVKWNAGVAPVVTIVACDRGAPIEGTGTPPIR